MGGFGFALGGEIWLGLFWIYFFWVRLEGIDNISIYIFSLSDCLNFWLSHFGQSCEGGLAFVLSYWIIDSFVHALCGCVLLFVFWFVCLLQCSVLS